jgi:endonuclease-3 related protein
MRLFTGRILGHPVADSMSSLRFMTVYKRLFDVYGPQHWWPGDTPFEIMVGAILTQNTAWSNVEKAIANLQAKDRLEPGAIAGTRRDHLANWLRPSGYFNVKAERLQAFCRWYLDAGGYAGLERLDTGELREALLGVRGVGPETADDILLYAFNRPVFVIDAYTRRLFTRLGRFTGDEPYEAMRHAFQQALGPDVQLLNEYHALVVRHAREVCRVRPACERCVLANSCPAAV